MPSSQESSLTYTPCRVHSGLLGYCHPLLPTGSQLMQPDLNPDPKASNHYLTSYKSESLAHEFEQDVEAKQKQGMMGTGEGACTWA